MFVWNYIDVLDVDPLCGRRPTLTVGEPLAHFLALLGRPGGGSTTRGSLSLDGECRDLHQIRRSQQPKPPVFAAPNSILTRDLYVRVIKKYKGSTMPVNEARNQAAQQAKVDDARDRIPLSQLRTTSL